jgi:hypothetical protein
MQCLGLTSDFAFTAKGAFTIAEINLWVAFLANAKNIFGTSRDALTALMASLKKCVTIKRPGRGNNIGNTAPIST